MNKLWLAIGLLAPGVSLAQEGTWYTIGDGEPYLGNDDYACSGNNHPIYWHDSQDIRDLIGEPCDAPGESFSVPVYAQQGWDCDEIFWFVDLECRAPAPASGTWELEGGQYWGNDDYACSGNNYPIYWHDSQDLRGLEGADCDTPGAGISVPVYARQGWDCYDVFLFQDLICTP